MTGADGGMGWQVLCYLAIPPVNNSRRRPTSKSSGACLTRPQASRRPELCAAQLCFLSECVAKGFRLREESEDYSMCLPDVLLCLQVFASVPKCPQVSASVRKRSQAPRAERIAVPLGSVAFWPGWRAPLMVRTACPSSTACPFWLGRRAPLWPGQRALPGWRAPLVARTACRDGGRAPFG